MIVIEVIGWFPLMDVKLGICVVQSVVVVEHSSADLQVSEADASGQATEVVDGLVVSSEKVEHLIGLSVVDEQHFLFGDSGVVGAVGDGAGVVVGVGSVEEHMIRQQIYRILFTEPVILIAFLSFKKLRVFFVQVKVEDDIFIIYQQMGQTCAESCKQIVNLPELAEIKAKKINSVQMSKKTSAGFPELMEVISRSMAKIRKEYALKEFSTSLPVVSHSNGLVYQGEWLGRQMHGSCRIIFPDRSYFQGRMSRGKIQGFGVLVHPTGEYYVGQFQNNKANGQGVYVGKDYQYQGSFKDNQQDGKGRYINCQYQFDGVFQKGQNKTGKIKRKLEIEFIPKQTLIKSKIKRSKSKERNTPKNDKNIKTTKQIQSPNGFNEESIKNLKIKYPKLAKNNTKCSSTFKTGK